MTKQRIPDNEVIILYTCDAQKTWTSAKVVGVFTDAYELQCAVGKLLNYNIAYNDSGIPLNDMKPNEIQNYVDYIMTIQHTMNILT